MKVGYRVWGGVRVDPEIERGHACAHCDNTHDLCVFSSENTTPRLSLGYRSTYTQHKTAVQRGGASNPRFVACGRGRKSSLVTLSKLESLVDDSRTKF